MKRMLVTVLLGGLATSLVGCTSRPVESITCDRLRALQLGMLPDEVRQILGQPVSDGPVLLPVPPGDTERRWDYEPIEKGTVVTGIRLEVTFVEGRLKEVNSWRTRLFASGPSVALFSLDATGHHEGKLFESYYCPK